MIDSGRVAASSAAVTRPELLDWAREHRGELVWSALVLVRFWLAPDRPRTAKARLGGFENWVRVIGGIVGHAGLPGFLANQDALRAHALDTSAADFIAAVRAQVGASEFQTKDVLALARDFLRIDGAAKVGIELTRLHGVPFGGLVLIRSGVTAGARRWRVEQWDR